MRKRVVLIGHTYTVKSNRDKIRRLAACPDLEVHLIVPLEWRHQTAGLQRAGISGQEGGYTLHALPVFRSGNNKRFLFRGIIRLLKELQPDIIHLEEEPFNRVTLQIVLLARLFLKNSRIILFTWENIYKKFKIHYRLLEKYNITHADVIICGNREAREIMEKKGATARLVLMPQYGVDLEPYQKPKIGSRFVRVGYIGRMVPEKGVLLLVRAFLRIPGRAKRLHLIGSGPLFSEIPKAPFIRKTGWVDGSRIPGYLRRMDILVLPSYTIRNWKEQFGHILIEAMAAGVAVIGSDSAEIPHVIGNAGLVFRERDEEDLYKKLLLLFKNRGLIGKFASRGLRRVKQLYLNGVLIRRTLGLYRRLGTGAR